MRVFIRTERDHLVRDELKRDGYVLDYWLVYRITQWAPTLRAGARGSSRRLHEQRLARL